jgi:hypothetical protein
MSQGLLKANLSAAGRKEIGHSACEDKRALGNKQLRVYIEHRTNLSSGGKVTPIEIRARASSFASVDRKFS